MENVKRQPVYVPGFDYYAVSKIDYNQFLKDREDAERYRKLKQEQETKLLNMLEESEKEITNGDFITLENLEKELGINNGN